MIIKCPNCSHYVSDVAPACPHCGAPIAGGKAPEPTPAPIVEEPAPAPVVEEPAPLVEEPAPAPVVEEPAPAPVVEEPAPAPVVEEPTPAPVVEEPTPAPVVEEPTPAPVVEEPAPAPVVEEPAPAPVVEEPAPAPVVEEPAPAPIVEEPAPAPVVEEPAPAPVVEEPVPAPVVEKTTPAPKPAPAPKKKTGGGPNMKLIGAILGVVLLLAVGGGLAYYFLGNDTEDEQAWSSVEGSQNAFDYEHYLLEFPKGKHVAEAQEQIDRLRQAEVDRKDDAAWQAALDENTIDGYQNYRDNYKRHADEAKERMDNLIRGEIAQEEGASTGVPVETEKPATPDEKPTTPAAKPETKPDTKPATAQRPERRQEPVQETPQQAAPQRGGSITLTPTGGGQQQPSVTQVTVTSNIPKAMVVIDGQDVGWAPWSGQLTPGMHTFAVKANNRPKLKTQDFNVRVSGRSTTVPINVPDPSVFK